MGGEEKSQKWGGEMPEKNIPALFYCALPNVLKVNVVYGSGTRTVRQTSPGTSDYI